MSLLPATVALEPHITCQTTGITGFRDGRLTVLPETGSGGGGSRTGGVDCLSRRAESGLSVTLIGAVLAQIRFIG